MSNDKSANHEEHAQLLGRIVANLQSLEFALRAYLYNNAVPPHEPFLAGMSLDSLRLGDVVNINAFTDYSSLESLIERYNRLVFSRKLPTDGRPWSC
jgi:hypothetical protein